MKLWRGARRSATNTPPGGCCLDAFRHERQRNMLNMELP
jgi:hypothetical protein